MVSEQSIPSFLWDEMLLMKENSLILANMRTTYRLYEAKHPTEQYWIEIEAENTSSHAYVGQCFASAARIYTLLLQGEVTPCTLQYIVEDYFA